MPITPSKKTSPKIGAILRAQRKARGLTLESISIATDMTKGFISEVERDKASPSVASLLRLCDALGIEIGSLFTSVDSAVIRSDERPPIKFGGIDIQDYLLTPKNAAMTQAIISIMAPGGTGGKELYCVQCDEEFVFVLKGSVTISIEDEETVLMKHDAMTFDPRRPHTFRNSSKSKPAEVLFMTMPPPK
jgi:transcriptional regulator with XRE-family HTH domain